MLDEFSRTELLIGKENLDKLKKSKVAIFGLGGVGSYVVEALARAGVSNFVLVDNDKVSISNINRQLIATYDTVDKLKVSVTKDRILSINKNAKIEIYNTFFDINNADMIDESIDYIVDAIDSVNSKIDLVKIANKLNIPIISSMGTGNKLDPTKFEVSDIYKTSVCPLAKVIRKRLKAENIKKLKVVYSKEEPKAIESLIEDGKRVNSSISFVPSVAGLIIASEVVKDLIKRCVIL